MAGSVNKVILVGNLGRDPEIRHTQDGNPVVNLSLATSENWKDRATGERRERTEWHRIVIFNEHLARVAEQYLRKGSKVYLEGQLQTRKWQDQSGQDRYTTEIVLGRFRGRPDDAGFAPRRRRRGGRRRGRGAAFRFRIPGILAERRRERRFRRRDPVLGATGARSDRARAHPRRRRGGLRPLGPGADRRRRRLRLQRGAGGPRRRRRGHDTRTRRHAARQHGAVGRADSGGRHPAAEGGRDRGRCRRFSPATSSPRPRAGATASSSAMSPANRRAPSTGWSSAMRCRCRA